MFYGVAAVTGYRLKLLYSPAIMVPKQTAVATEGGVLAELDKNKIYV